MLFSLILCTEKLRGECEGRGWVHGMWATAPAAGAFRPRLDLELVYVCKVVPVVWSDMTESAMLDGAAIFSGYVRFSGFTTCLLLDVCLVEIVSWVQIL